jgi:hypothetical protein
MENRIEKEYDTLFGSELKDLEIFQEEVFGKNLNEFNFNMGKFKVKPKPLNLKSKLAWATAGAVVGGLTVNKIKNRYRIVNRNAKIDRMSDEEIMDNIPENEYNSSKVNKRLDKKVKEKKPSRIYRFGKWLFS